MAWKPTGRPTVRQQRGKWVVRVDGIDTETGLHRPRQLGTFTSRRAAQKAATSFAADGTVGPDRDTIGHLVDAWVASRVDVSPKTRLRYEWAAAHIRAASAPSGWIDSSARTDTERVVGEAALHLPSAADPVGGASARMRD